MGMYGAIIGDLAAWTYEHHVAQFYSRLVAEDAESMMIFLLFLRKGYAA